MEKSSKTKPHKIKSVGKKEIDLVLMAKAIWKKLWLVILAAVLVGGLAFIGTKLFIKPVYRSSFTAYVNNKKEVDLNSLTAQDIAASKSLAHTFEEVIKSKSVLVKAAESIDLNYSYSQLSKMISTSISNETEIITVSADTGEPELSYKLADAVREYSLAYTAEIIEGSSMKIIDYPEVPGGIYSPSYSRFAIIGALAGFLISALIICIRQYFNDRIQDEVELAEHYTLAIIGVIPDILNADKNKGNYYSYYGHSSDNHENRFLNRKEENK